MNTGGRVQRLLKDTGLSRLFLILFSSLVLIPFALRSWYPIGHGLFMQDRAFRDFLFQMIGLASVGLLIPMKEIRWFWWAVLACHFIGRDALFKGWASPYLLHMAVTWALFWFVYHYTELPDLRTFCLLLTIGCVIQLIFQELQVLGIDPVHVGVHPNNYFQPVYDRPAPTGFMGHLTGLGVYYALCLPATYITWLPVAFLAWAGLLFSMARIGWGAAFITLILFQVLLEKFPWTTQKENMRLWLCVVGVCSFPFILSGLPTVSPFLTTSLGRMAIWKHSIPFWIHPWIGNGLGSWLHGAFTLPGEWFIQAHNEYWQALFELGIIPCLFLLLYLVRLVYRIKLGWKYIQDKPLFAAFLCGVGVILISSFSYFPLHLTPLSAIFIVYWAGLESMLRRAYVGIA